jgi:hypothetical protein
MNRARLDVITKAKTYDLTVLETAKDELGVDGNQMDVRLKRWITEVSFDAARFCNRVFAIEEVLEVWHASNLARAAYSGEPNALTLARYPIVKIISVTETDTVLTPEDYEYEVSSGRLWRRQSACRSDWWADRVEVRYQGGYDVPVATPPDLQEACLLLLKYRNDGHSRDRFQRSQDVPGVLREEFFNPASGTDSGMPPEVCSKLEGFREYN